MAISPPSDLVLDVVRAADPTQVQEAQAKLKANKAAFEATSLADAGNGFASAVSLLGGNKGTASLSDISNRTEAPKIPEVYRKFEAMVLQNFVKSMLPSDSEGIYGKGTAGDMWKSMMADQLGAALAEGDGIGIAARLSGGSSVFADSATDRVNAETGGNNVNVAASMVQEYERKAVSSLTDDEAGPAAVSGAV
ncbi:rod-binding protein [Ensifer soli]|uniref:rod-binding protein n=1 Tax=Ciceribacter sp. sgz301302 TaxID=3342379 RepID=UPI0035BA59D9